MLVRRAALSSLTLLCMFGSLSAACGDDSQVPTGSATSSTGGSGGSGGGGGMGGGMGGGTFDGIAEKPVIYQLVVRHFGNTNTTRTTDGTLVQNGAGKFDDVNEAALTSLKAMGVTHVWLTGVLRQATLTDRTELGIPADDGDIVKGRAGSFYAVKDYYDVCPDYATDPTQRMAEFEALVARIHAQDLKVMIDLVPNHVSRSYASVVKPAMDFGAGDDTTAFFSGGNNFFYLASPPGQVLALSKPATWNPAGVTFDGVFAREDGTGTNVPRATGNNVTSVSPSATDWYETVKLNYGWNFVDSSKAYDPIPNTWTKVDDILGYWQGKGVDGFRVDFAHFVPVEAWTYLLGKAKERNATTYFMAEAYENLEGLLASGFDAVYHDATYDTLKLMYLGKRSQSDLDALLGGMDEATRGRYVEYLENHDERRIASPIVPGDSADDTGFGSANAGRQLGPLAYLYSNGPVLFYNGQEVGEPGAGVEGFGGDDGRTTIFDYWSLPALVPWVGNHSYDGAGLSAEQTSLRGYYGDLLRLLQDPNVRGNRYWGLKYFNNATMFPDANDALFSFARFAQGRGSLALVISNFAVGAPTTAVIRIPVELADAAGLDASATLKVRRVLGAGGAIDEAITDTTKADLTEKGFSVTIEDQGAGVFIVSP